MTISLVMLTYNRAEFAERSMTHNLAHAGANVDELIWVDNGSSDEVREVMRRFEPDVSILNKQNLGVSKGLNRGFAVATCDYILITGPDMLMPEGWLARFRNYLCAIPNSGVACWFHQDPNLDFAPLEHSNGLSYHPCTPWAAIRIVSRELLFKRIGLLREDFGLYGWEDVEWAHRALRVCKEDGLLAYALPGQRAEHLGTPLKDPREYRTFKREQVTDAAKKEKLKQLKAENFPYFNPFA